MPEHDRTNSFELLSNGTFSCVSVVCARSGVWVGLLCHSKYFEWYSTVTNKRGPRLVYLHDRDREEERHDTDAKKRYRLWFCRRNKVSVAFFRSSWHSIVVSWNDAKSVPAPSFEKFLIFFHHYNKHSTIIEFFPISIHWGKRLK